MKSGYAPVDGLEMYYELHGGEVASGVTPLVLLHGGLQTIELSFGTLVERFAEQRPVIALELQGHGRTPDADRALSLERLALDVVQVLGHLEVAQADFLGFSLGGLVSLEVAVEHPEVVRRLVLVSAHHQPDAFFPEITDEAGTSPRLPTAEDFEAMANSFAAVAPDPGAFEAVMTKYQPVVHDEFTGWSADQLRALPQPTLVILGDFDFFPVEHAAEMVELIPRASLAVLPRTRHIEAIGRPAAAGFIEDFLAAADDRAQRQPLS